MKGPLIIAGVPTNVNEIIAKEIAAGTVPPYEPPEGAATVACDQCSNPMWIGPKQRAAVEANGDSLTKLCQPCAVLNTNALQNATIHQLDRQPLSPETRRAADHLLHQVDLEQENVGWDLPPMMWWLTATDGGDLHVDHIPIPMHVWGQLEAQPHPLLREWANRIALGDAGPMVEHVRSLPGRFVGFMLVAEAYSNDEPIRDEFHGRLRAMGLDASAREERMVAVFLNHMRLVSLTRFRGKSEPEPVREMTMQEVIADRATSVSALVWALIDNMSTALGREDVGAVL